MRAMSAMRAMLMLALLAMLAMLAMLAAVGCCPKRPIQPPPMDSCKRPARTMTRRLPLGLKLRLVSGRARPPATVQMLFTAQVLGRPFTGLRAADLTLSEETVASRKPLGRPVLLPLGAAAMTQTMVLVDITGDLQAPRRRAMLQQRLSTIVRRLLGTQSVALAVFDGGAGIRVLQSFTHQPALLEAALKRLPTLTARDPSRNLNGAVVAALREIELYGAQASPRFELSTLVVITSGPDLAARTKPADLRRLVGSHHRQGTLLFGVGVGPWAGKPVLRTIGKTAYFTFADHSQFDAAAAKRLAHTLRSHVESHYVLSHCSSRRQGNHRLHLGARGRRTSLSYDFDAFGFRGGCNATRLAHSCKVIQCGGPPGSACHRCAESKQCYRNRCLPRYLAQEFLAEDRARQKATVAAAKRAQAERMQIYRTCLSQRSEQQRRWQVFRQRKQRFDQADCGLRFLAELGSRGYPPPKGVAGALLAGWSLGRWLELHGGLGFSTIHAVGLVQARLKVLRWRILDLMVIGRFGVGGGEQSLLLHADLLLGFRLKLGRYLGLYAAVGPGYAYASQQNADVTKQSFVLPFWLGAELRL